jgi:hypothetical protein
MMTVTQQCPALASGHTTHHAVLLVSGMPKRIS